MFLLQKAGVLFWLRYDNAQQYESNSANKINQDDYIPTFIQCLIYHFTI